MTDNRGLWRGKRLDNGEWVEGYYVHLSDGENEEHRIYTGYAETDCGDCFPDFYKVDPEALGECASLTDKNDKLAFEGDLINSHFGGNVGVIRRGEYKNPFNDDKFAKHIGFYVEWLTGSDKDALRMDLGYWLPAVEIVGNIYDNPELLKGENNEM